MVALAIAPTPTAVAHAIAHTSSVALSLATSLATSLAIKTTCISAQLSLTKLASQLQQRNDN